MGACGSSMTAEEKLAEKRSKEIERQNATDKRKDDEIIKLLLLGAGESGKSTIFKQMKILYGKDYSEEDLRNLLPVVYSNINWNLRQVVDAAIALAIPIECADVADRFRKEVSDDTPVVGEVGEIVRTLWNDPGIQKAWAERSNYQVLDGLAYYMTNLDRILSEDYVPSKLDILTARVRTSGIVEERYKISGVDFVLFDVGGQRNERKKWIHCFDNVTAVIFVAAINEYDQKLFEDSTTNRIDEAVELFANICNNDWFRKTSMILFLNKKDIFEEKIFSHPLRVPGVRHDDFEGPYANDPGVSREAAIEAAENYMISLFVAVKRNPKKDIYTHITCATDTRNVHVVFEACKDIILRENLVGSGFMESTR